MQIPSKVAARLTFAPRLRLEGINPAKLHSFHPLSVKIRTHDGRYASLFSAHTRDNFINRPCYFPASHFGIPCLLSRFLWHPQTEGIALKIWKRLARKFHEKYSIGREIKEKKCFMERETQNFSLKFFFLVFCGFMTRLFPALGESSRRSTD